MMSKNVLLVDDNADTRAIYEQCSTDDVRLTVTSGESALRLLDENEFDAVLLDLSMVPIDGLTMAQQIRMNEQTHSHKKPVHLAFFTARVIDETIREIAAETNVEMIFQKPCDPFELIEKICVWLNAAPYFTEKVNRRQNGHSNPNALIIFIAVIAQIAAGTIFLWLNHRTQENWAINWSEMRSQRDQYKKICDSNLLLDTQKETWIKQQGLEVPAQLSGQTPCVATENKEGK